MRPRSAFRPSCLQSGAAEKPPRRRRLPPTSEVPGSRTIPAAVQRAVLERAGGRCEFGGCPRRAGLQYVHLQAHTEGGDREATNLARGCKTHHKQYDKGDIRLVGWTEEGPPGVARPIFRVWKTGKLLRPKDRVPKLPQSPTEDGTKRPPPRRRRVSRKDGKQKERRGEREPG